MPEQRRWLGLLLGSAIVVVAGAAGTARADADADDPDMAVPSVCAPPCPDGQICVGNRCVVQGRRSTAPPRRATSPPPPPPAPAGSASTTGPQPIGPPHPGRAPAPSYPPPQPTPYPPPPGYAPPPGYPQPLGWYYPPPPPPYVQPLGYYYPQPLPPPPRPARLKRRFLALPFLGMHSYQNKDASLYGPGLRLGTLMGVRTSDRFSINGELTFNFSNVNGAPAGFREYSIDLAIAPLWQIPAASVEFVFGPKAGFFVVDSENPGMGIGTSATQNGIVLGVNSGIFVPVSAATSMGVLLTVEFREPSEVCYSDGIGNEYCMSAGASFNSLVGLTAAALF